MGQHEHRARAPRHLRIAVLSVSSTRSLDNDESGQWIAGQAGREGHQVAAHCMVRDDAELIRQALCMILAEKAPQAVIVTGGTGISPKDVTIEAIKPLFEKELTAFSTLFANLSYQEIGPAAVLSRATAGIVGTCVVYCLPGSLKACKLACCNLIFPEVGHLLGHIQES